MSAAARALACALPLLLAAAAAPVPAQEAAAAAGCTDLGAGFAFCAAGTGWEGVTAETLEAGLALARDGVELSVQAIATDTPLPDAELRLTVTDMAERLIGTGADLAAFRPILEDRPEAAPGTAMRVAFVSGAFGEPLVFALTLVGGPSGVALVQSSAAAEYLDETHSALHRDALAALAGTGAAAGGEAE